MPSYVITGTSKGIGYEFLRQLSSDPNNTVIGLVRDKPTTDKKLAEQLNPGPNVHILQADITDYDTKAAAEVAKITGGSLDYLIANAAFYSMWSAFDSLGKLGDRPQELEQDLVESFKTNVVGNIHLFNLFMPLILKGRTKKVVAISTGAADMDQISKYEMDAAAPYAISKAAMNLAVAKFHAQYAKDGVLIMSICPGVVDTGHFNNLTEEQRKGAGVMMAKFSEYAPHFKGPDTPEDSVRAVMSIINKASVQNGDGGSYVSHFGNKQWI